MAPLDTLGATSAGQTEVRCRVVQQDSWFLKPEIFIALSSLLNELQSMEEAKALHSVTRPFPTSSFLSPCPSDEQVHQDLCLMHGRRPEWFQGTLATRMYVSPRN